MPAMDTQLQNFWIESINKEAALRFAWQLKYSKTFAKAATKKKFMRSQEGGSKPGAKVNANIARHIEQMERDLEKDRPTPTTSSEEDSDEAEKPPTTYVHDMRPASPETRAQIYEGISHHGEGRKAYLKKRQNKSPEEKYVFPILSSCVYGWKILDFGTPKCSPYARTRVVRDTFYRHSGIIPHGCR